MKRKQTLKSILDSQKKQWLSHVCCPNCERMHAATVSCEEAAEPSINADFHAARKAAKEAAKKKSK
jgi:hypothetical protein